MRTYNFQKMDRSGAVKAGAFKVLLDKPAEGGSKDGGSATESTGVDNEGTKIYSVSPKNEEKYNAYGYVNDDEGADGKRILTFPASNYGVSLNADLLRDRM